MLKFLIILGLIFYIIYRIGGFFFKMVFMSAQQQRSQNGQYQKTNHRKSNSDNINIDYIPKGSKKSQDFKGGDYVDFEEVK